MSDKILTDDQWNLIQDFKEHRPEAVIDPASYIAIIDRLCERQSHNLKRECETEEDLNAALARAEKLDIQLAGCGCAALGYNDKPAKKGDYGWSASYQDVLDLRGKYNAALGRVKELEDIIELGDRAS